jgi:hypothetical protein
LNWFEAITGFRESSYADTQRRLRVADGKLVSDASEKRYSAGTLEIISLGELRERTARVQTSGPTKFSVVQGDVRRLHAVAENRGSLFQVASQFNLLEMVSYTVSPEDGVTRYESDRTQGPACAIAAGAATIYRNYLHPFPDGSRGQTAERQIDCLTNLARALGSDTESPWSMRNGYTLFTEESLGAVDDRLGALGEGDFDSLRSLARIGLHWNVDVTDLNPGHQVSQAFCSAVPVSYNGRSVQRSRWQRFAKLVLEAAYEATLRAGVLNADAGNSNVVYLTSLGGGAFGNETIWIHKAMKRAFDIATNWGLDVRVVSFGLPDEQLLRLVSQAQD